VERALALSPGRSQIDPTALPQEVLGAAGAAVAGPSMPAGGIDLEAVLAETERVLVTGALERTGGNKHQAARLLGLKRTTLVEKLKRMNRRLRPA
jgi:DNA-binding NtrC family response regulator